MGFPVGYTELFLPKLFIHTLSFLGFLRKFISILFSYLGLQDFIEPDFTANANTSYNYNYNNTNAFFSAWHDPNPTRVSEFGSVSAAMIRELLPVVRFSELVAPPESCAVCLYEFESEDEIRRLTNCCHIFHRGCLDRWMGYDQKTCPLCRTPFLRDDFINERLCSSNSSYGLHDFEYSQVTTGL